jgi:hypothetical protein
MYTFQTLYARLGDPTNTVVLQLFSSQPTDTYKTRQNKYDTWDDGAKSAAPRRFRDSAVYRGQE